MDNLFDYKDCFSEFRDVKSHLVLGDKDKRSPKVSILMPVYSHFEFFEQALLSAIHQDFNDDYEIVVVDNNPIGGDKTEYQKVIERADSSKIMYYRNENNIGLFGNWNRCVELARGQYVTFLHDDDMLLPNCLTVLMEAASRHGVKLLFPEQIIIDSENQILETSLNISKRCGFIKLKNEYSIDLLDKFIRNRGCGVGCLYSKNCIIELGGYNKEYDPSSDYALNIRYVEKYGAIAISKCLYNYRRAVNYSYDCFNRWPDIDKVIRRDILKRKKFSPIVANIIINAFYRVQIVYVNSAFGGTNSINNIKDKPSMVDRAIYNLILRFSRIKCFQL